MSAIEDAAQLALSYRSAAEADTMETMNVQSSGTGLDDLLFYIVPADWFRTAWKLLLSPRARIPEDWREQIGALPAVKPWFESNGNGADTTAADERADGTTNEPKSPWGQRAWLSKAQAHSTKQHKKDYFFVGQNAWGVLANKFGSSDSTHAVPCHVVSFPQQDSKLAVNLPDATRIPIPASGRFPYEDVLENDDKDRMEDAPSSIKIEEDEDDPMDSEQSAREGPILTLPNSTTPQSPARHRSSAASHTPRLRQYGSGLANLGNTCFMSSMIQCLGHAPPVLRYFLSGKFMADLNKRNPLGTGGEMAIEFSKLLREIWVEDNAGSSTHLGYVSNHIVYPRHFKYTVGRHAEQFSGYDQHDSQEFATYLLDALHEDTNRISKKPYIEKPEQGENETDEEAADKAWQLHLQRENSHIVDLFMGQVKSRVQCCEENCGRVSTTFDPFMYLSVPIPGNDDRKCITWFIPLDPDRRPIKMTLIVPKTGTVADMIKKCRDRVVKLMNIDPSELAEEDMVAADVWNNEIYNWREPGTDISEVGETDQTYIFQLRPLEDVRQLSKASPADTEVDDTLDMPELASSGRRFQLDIGTLKELNHGDAWHRKFESYLKNIRAFHHVANSNGIKGKGRKKFLQQVMAFIDECHQVLEKDASFNNTPDFEDGSHSRSIIHVHSNVAVPGLVSLCEVSEVFENVTSVYDVAVFEFCADKLREHIVNIFQKKQANTFPDGAIVSVKSRKSDSTTSGSHDTPPLVLRIPANMTVFELREELARRMRRSIRTGPDSSPALAGALTSEAGTSVSGSMSHTSPGRAHMNEYDAAFGSPESLVLRQIPMSWTKKKAAPSIYSPRHQLGALAKPNTLRSFENYDRSSPLASPSEADERERVASTVGDYGNIYLEWPDALFLTSFDTYEFNSFEEAADDKTVLADCKPKEATTVLDCIDKYCQMEQLEETEMWYCSKCKKHVRAWKQFHLYRAPPFLIIHLKRFQYSAISHRRDKISEFIDFPLQGLDLTKHFSSWKEAEKPIYDCFGVSNHYGGLGGGHYTAHALHSDGVWCYYDDTRITKDVDPESVVTDAAYVLYYRRQDVPTDVDFTISTEAPELPAPAVILENPGEMNGNADTMSDSNAALIVGDDENMEVDHVDDASRSTVTCPMESMGWEAEQSNQQPLHEDDTIPDIAPESPLQ